jgi:signal transduction histidine kinase
MSTLMDDLLAFARVGQSALSPETVDVTALCAELIADLRLATSPHDAEVTIAPDLAVIADPALLKVALANVLGNAWKYSARAPVARVEVGTGPRGLYVRDNGIGFDMADAELLFTPFTRLKNARDLPGTGIGLATVRKIVERHGGTVGAESALGNGATFYLALPA